MLDVDDADQLFERRHRVVQVNRRDWSRNVARPPSLEELGNFLARTPDTVAEPLDARYGRASGAGRQRLPGEDGMDGFFYARLRKA